MQVCDVKMSNVRTTIRIEDDLFRRLKERAAKTGRTIGEIVEDALRQSFQRSKQQTPRPHHCPSTAVQG